MTNAEAWFNIALRPRKPEGSLGRTAQDGHLDSHTALELWSAVSGMLPFQWTALRRRYYCTQRRYFGHYEFTGDLGTFPKIEAVPTSPVTSSPSVIHSCRAGQGCFTRRFGKSRRKRNDGCTAGTCAHCLPAVRASHEVSWVSKSRDSLARIYGVQFKTKDEDARPPLQRHFKAGKRPFRDSFQKSERKGETNTGVERLPTRDTNNENGCVGNKLHSIVDLPRK